VRIELHAVLEFHAEGRNLGMKAYRTDVEPPIELSQAGALQALSDCVATIVTSVAPPEQPKVIQPASAASAPLPIFGW